MPAPQASMMAQLARAKFSSFGLVVPPNYRPPSGTHADHYNQYAFSTEHKQTAPDPTVPPLFRPATLVKQHTDAQKQLTASFGKYLDGITSAICSAWSTWQTAASMAGILVAGPLASGGVLNGPMLEPLIMGSGPTRTAFELKYTRAIAQTLSTAWAMFSLTVKIPGLPWFPAFAAFPGPMAPPMPNIPCPFAALTQAPTPISASVLKGQMVAALADPTAPHSNELFEAVSDAFEKSYNLWKASTMVTKVMGLGPIPTFAPPVVPAGPVVGGTATMAPGGLV